MIFRATFYNQPMSLCFMMNTYCFHIVSSLAQGKKEARTYEFGDNFVFSSLDFLGQGEISAHLNTVISLVLPKHRDTIMVLHYASELREWHLTNILGASWAVCPRSFQGKIELIYMLT